MIRRLILLIVLALSVCVGAAHAAPAGAALPTDSVYRTALALRDQAGHPFALASLRGHPVIVSMIYASCAEVCPITVESIRGIRDAVRARTGHEAPPVVLISFDPARDTVAALAMMASMHHVEAPTWRLARPDQGDVRGFAATLGVSYRKRPNGDFDHNVEIALLDAEGRIVAKTSEIGAPDPAFIDRVSRVGKK
jgi:protein SCO1/2